MSGIRPVASQETPSPDTAPQNVDAPAAAPPSVQPVVRPFDAHDRQTTAPAPAPRPAGNPLAPRPRRRPVLTPSDSNPNAILQVVSAIPLFSSSDLGLTSYVIPSSLALFQIVHILDNLMATTRRFVQSAPTWHPIVSHLYFSMLWFFQVLRAQREAGELSLNLIHLLNLVENYFDFRSLAVPGPLVHYYSALSVAACADEVLGNAYHGLPPHPSTYSKSAWLPDSSMACRIPDIPFLLDIFVRQVFGRTQAPPADVNYDLSNMFGITLDSNTTARWHTRCANQWFLSEVPADIWQSCHNNRRLMTVPPALSHDALTAPSWDQWLRLSPRSPVENLPDWSSPIVTIMQRYCGFFSDSVSLDQIPATSSGSLFVQIAYRDDVTQLITSDPAPSVTANPASPPPAESSSTTSKRPASVTVSSEVPPDVQRLPSMAAALRHNHRDLPLLHLQTGALTQTHVLNLDSRVAKSSTYSSSSGPAWEVRPYYQESSAFDYSRVVGGNIVDNYHKDSRN
nr:capsid protein [Lasiodiplodia ziziphi partitivirus 1]